MLQKIRYRLTWNRSGRLNRRGEGLIQIECQQQLGHQKIQTTKIYNEARQTQRKAIERGLKRK